MADLPRTATNLQQPVEATVYLRSMTCGPSWTLRVAWSGGSEDTIYKEPHEHTISCIHEGLQLVECLGCVITSRPSGRTRVATSMIACLNVGSRVCVHASACGIGLDHWSARRRNSIDPDMRHRMPRSVSNALALPISRLRDDGLPVWAGKSDLRECRYYARPGRPLCRLQGTC
jgi:hypothetical protein